MWEKKFYTLRVTTQTEEGKVNSVYERYRKIKFRFNKEKRTLRAVLIDSKGNKTIVEKVNVESVEKYPYKGAF
ncbi:MAG: hypothetical protein HFJ41_01810 [Clostridia bacterium]|nr:hypothetical protein [Clostridia bacterium]